MKEIFRIESVSQIHEMLRYEKPRHPLISLIESSKIKPGIQFADIRVISSLYTISLKNGSECRIKYGRENYDFQEGSLIFLAPEQTIESITESENQDLKNWEGWLLIFHPDLIRKSTLVKKMSEYTFFSYDSSEALHLSEQERKTVTDIVKKIQTEYSGNLDTYSHELIISNLELLFNYCKRFYARQFITRTDVNKDISARFEEYLKNYFNSDKPKTEGLPTVKQCGKEMCYSPNYLSDLLKKETGKNTLEHIHFHLIEKAKNMLLGSENSVKDIAFTLGFEYPQHFSKFFKNKTGISPVEYRN